MYAGIDRQLTRPTVEVHHVFSEVSYFGSSRPLQKTDLGEKKKLLPDEKSHGLL